MPRAICSLELPEKAKSKAKEILSSSESEAHLLFFIRVRRARKNFGTRTDGQRSSITGASGRRALCLDKWRALRSNERTSQKSRRICVEPIVDLSGKIDLLTLAALIARASLPRQALTPRPRISPRPCARHKSFFMDRRIHFIGGRDRVPLVILQGGIDGPVTNFSPEQREAR